jgi:DNA-binding NtrC family response regulator|tara:strand:- start:666 stop:2252 length:1587 start_codon:yes stop_codon:yes gene_type:complete
VNELANLAAAPSLDAAYAIVDKQLRVIANKNLQGEFSGASISQVVFHIRDTDAYRTVASLPGADINRDLASSAAMWQMVLARKHPVSLDVTTALVQWEPGGMKKQFMAQLLEALSEYTRAQFSQRGTTHILAIPMFLPGGEVVGMVTLEAVVSAAIGELETVVNIGPPFLYLFTSTPDKEQNKLPIDALVQTFANQHETVLILGETGTGKSRLAEKIHRLSYASAGPFITFSLLGVNEDLQLAQLFGWKKGAFTGAIDSNFGLIHQAEGGTLFIDEIDKLSLSAQSGLLQLLESKVYYRLGDSVQRSACNIRFLVATNRNLLTCVENGTFREDLYYRINVLPLQLPALRETPWMMDHWIDVLLESLSLGNAYSIVFARSARRLLKEQIWPGNIRQLDNTLRRSIALAGPVEAGSLELEVSESHVVNSLSMDGAGGGRNAFLGALESTARAYLAQPNPDHTVLKNNPLFALTWALASVGSGNVETTAKLVGKRQSILSRNYQREFDREVEKLRDLYLKLGEPAPSFLER